MAQTTLAVAQVTLLDLNDAIISGTMPSSPTIGTLWIDNSQNPNVLKEWNGSAWVTQTLALQYLDNGSYQIVTASQLALNNMASDSAISQTERITIKSDVTDLIGFVPFDNNYGITNFVNKVSGSTVANPNIAYYSGSASILAPTGAWTEDTSSYYTNIATQNSTVFTISTGAASTGTAQALYKFDLINYVKNTYGYTPTVTWLENNVKEIKFNRFGYGTGINGNKSYVDAWNTATNAKWGSPVNTTSGAITLLSWDSTVNQTNVQNLIDSNGFCYFLSYSDAVAAVATPAALTSSSISAVANAGMTQATGTIYITFTWLTANGETTAPTSYAYAYTTGNNIKVTLPTFPTGVTSAKIYMGTVSGSEKYQGTTATTTYTQSTVLAAVTAKPASNTAYVSSIDNTDYAELQVTLWPIPTTIGLDAMGVGSFATIRKAATQAGLLTSDTNYTNLAAQYNTLVNYLEGLTPVFPWSVATTDVITITPSTWRNNWNNYYLAEYQLQQATTTALQGNINGIQVGGRNLLRNSGNFTDTSYWSLNIGSAVTGVLNPPTEDSVYGNVIKADLTANAASGNNWWVLQNNGFTMPNGKFTAGQIYTLSFLIQNSFPVTVSFKDSDGTNSVVSSSFSVSVNANWTRVWWTFTASATGNVPELYMAKADNTSTGSVLITQIKLELGNRATDWFPAPEDLITSLANLQGRISDVESLTTDDSIINTVTSSNAFTNALDGKADSTDLANYATADQLTQAQNDLNAAIQSGIAGIDFTPYVTQTQLTQTSQGLTEQITSSGGVNMVLNSVGFSGTDFWTVTNDTGGLVSTTQAAELDPFGSFSGFSLNGGKLDQNITVTPGIPYTLSAYVKKGTLGTGYVQISETAQPPQTFNLVAGTAYSYQYVNVTITPTTSTLTVELYGDTTSGGVIITSLIVNIGTAPFTWQQAPGEVYNTNIRFDINGIRVSQYNSSGVQTKMTVMTPSLFAGYADVDGNGVIDPTIGGPDEVFRMDTDTFVMKSATIKPIKIIPIAANGHNGIAFVASS